MNKNNENENEDEEMVVLIFEGFNNINLYEKCHIEKFDMCIISSNLRVNVHSGICIICLSSQW